MIEGLSGVPVCGLWKGLRQDILATSSIAVLLTGRPTKARVRVVSSAEGLDHEPKSDPSAAEGNKF
jgi:hypothetical protein